MRHLLFLLLLVSSVYALNDFGYSRMLIERTWTIEHAEGSNVTFRGLLAVNNSNQQIINISLDPGIGYEVADNGVVYAVYSGPVHYSPFVIKGAVLVDVDYNTDIAKDVPLDGAQLNFTDLTMPDDSIRTEARLLSNDKSYLRTIESLVNWVHAAITYDVSYWGRTLSAQEVYAGRRGVCAEYTHLMLSMARSLGMESRYVSGYVFSANWQPHAWAEFNVPGYGWLPSDPTFGQAGILDNSHIAVNYGEDQSSSYDLLRSYNPNITMEASINITEVFSGRDVKGAAVSLDFDKQTYIADVSVANKRPDFLFGSYSFYAPDGYGPQNVTVLLLSPNESVHKYHGMNRSVFEDGFSYSLPLKVSFNDAFAEKEIVISGLGPVQDGVSCAPAFLLLSLAILKLFY